MKFQDVTYTEELVLKSLGLEKKQLAAHTAIQPVYGEKAYLLVPVKHKQVLDALHPDLKMMDKISKTLDLIGMYVFAEKGSADGNKITAKLFRRGCGTSEEMVGATLVLPEEQEPALNWPLSLA